MPSIPSSPNPYLPQSEQLPNPQLLATLRCAVGFQHFLLAFQVVFLAMARHPRIANRLGKYNYRAAIFQYGPSPIGMRRRVSWRLTRDTMASAKEGLVLSYHAAVRGAMPPC